MRTTKFLPISLFVPFFSSTTLALPQTLTTPTPVLGPQPPEYYDSLFSGYCAEISSSTRTSVISTYPIPLPGPMWTGTLAGTVTWSTIYPSPTPTSFPTTVVLSVIMTVTQEMWNVRTVEGKTVREGYASVVYPIVVSASETVLETRPAGLEKCTTIGGN
ncbi:hypothetical protein V8F20_012098 [Naviculisporaceae sp. PSN 640]